MVFRTPTHRLYIRIIARYVFYRLVSHVLPFTPRQLEWGTCGTPQWLYTKFREVVLMVHPRGMPNENNRENKLCHGYCPSHEEYDKNGE